MRSYDYKDERHRFILGCSANILAIGLTSLALISPFFIFTFSFLGTATQLPVTWTSMQVSNQDINNYCQPALNYFLGSTKYKAKWVNYLKKYGEFRSALCEEVNQNFIESIDIISVRNRFCSRTATGMGNIMPLVRDFYHSMCDALDSSVYTTIFSVLAYFTLLIAVIISLFYKLYYINNSKNENMPINEKKRILRISLIFDITACTIGFLTQFITVFMLFLNMNHQVLPHHDGILNFFSGSHYANYNVAVTLYTFFPCLISLIQLIAIFFTPFTPIIIKELKLKSKLLKDYGTAVL